MTNQPTTIAEIAEADAPAEIGAVYAEFRRLTAAPMVALIWRHLATFPGLLPEIGNALAPLMQNGRLQEAAWRAAEAGVTGHPATLRWAGLVQAGVDQHARADFKRVLDAYNRVNPVNFLAVRLLVLAIEQAGEGDTVSRPNDPGWTPPRAIAPLPPMAPISALAGEARRLIDALSADPGVDRSTVVPTLYRHLTQPPALIPLIHAALIDRFRSGEIAAAIRAVTGAMGSEALQLLPALGSIVALRDRPELQPVLVRFSSLIPEMIVVGVLLRRGLDTGEGS